MEFIQMNKKEQRRIRIGAAINKFKSLNLDFKVFNGGIEIHIIDYESNKWKFYPTTGNYQSINEPIKGNGLNNLLRAMNVLK